MHQSTLWRRWREEHVASSLPTPVVFAQVPAFNDPRRKICGHCQGQKKILTAITIDDVVMMYVPEVCWGCGGTGQGD